MGYRSLYFYASRKSSKDGFPVRCKSSIHRQPSPPFAFHFPSPCCEWSIIRGDLPSIYCSIHTECSRGSIIARAGRSDFGSSSRIPTKNQAIVFRRIDQLIPHILRHAPHYTHPDHAKSGVPNFSALRSLFSIL